MENIGGHKSSVMQALLVATVQEAYANNDKKAGCCTTSLALQTSMNTSLFNVQEGQALAWLVQACNDFSAFGCSAENVLPPQAHPSSKGRIKRQKHVMHCRVFLAGERGLCRGSGAVGGGHNTAGEVIHRIQQEVPAEDQAFPSPCCPQQGVRSRVQGDVQAAGPEKRICWLAS